MPYFAVILEGQGINVPVITDGIAAGRPIVGFYTTRIVKAATEEAAICKAQSVVTQEWSRPPLSITNTGNLSSLSIEKITPLSLLSYLFAKSPKGHTFYRNE